MIATRRLNDKVLIRVGLAFGLLCLQPVIAQQNRGKESNLIGSWYMNTPTKNCRISLSDHGMLTVITVTGGFLHKEECIKAGWKLEGQKIVFDELPVKAVLGNSLLISRDKSETTLVPQNELDQITKDGMRFHYCFRREPR